MKSTTSALVNLNEVISLAWADDVSFDEIERQLGVTEGDIIRIMRGHLKLKSFKVWRARVSGRKAKHEKLARAYAEAGVQNG